MSNSESILEYIETDDFNSLKEVLKEEHMRIEDITSLIYLMYKNSALNSMKLLLNRGIVDSFEKNTKFNTTVLNSMENLKTGKINIYSALGFGYVDIYTIASYIFTKQSIKYNFEGTEFKITDTEKYSVLNKLLIHGFDPFELIRFGRNYVLGNTYTSSNGKENKKILIDNLKRTRNIEIQGEFINCQFYISFLGQCLTYICDYNYGVMGYTLDEFRNTCDLIENMITLNKMENQGVIDENEIVIKLTNNDSNILEITIKDFKEILKESVNIFQELDVGDKEYIQRKSNIVNYIINILP